MLHFLFPRSLIWARAGFLTQQDGAQGGAHASEVPGSAGQLGSPQAAPGQPMKLSEAMLSQLQYHPPVGAVSDILLCLRSRLQHCHVVLFSRAPAQSACCGCGRSDVLLTSHMAPFPWYGVSMSLSPF